MSDIVIRSERIGKRYSLARSVKGARYRTLREDLMDMPKKLLRWYFESAELKEREIWALRDISFEVERGEVLGLIGRNGAGKSTLLKILSRITAPSCGCIDMFGRVGSLLEVGTGFHQELTGRENIFLSGAILGMRRLEIRKRFDEIVGFADIDMFVDEPVKHYSSGMYARLAFAVASHLRTDILLMDEVLAVGDAEFRKKCASKVGQVVKEHGCTVVLVSHEPALIRTLCSRAILMDGGRVEYSSEPQAVLERYHQNDMQFGNVILDGRVSLHPGVSLSMVEVGGSTKRHQVLAADSRTLDVEVRGSIEFPARVTLAVRLRSGEGIVLAVFSPGHELIEEKVKPGAFQLRHRIRLPRLLAGRYILEILLTDPNIIGWATISEAVYLDVEGTTTCLGMLSAGSHSGWLMLESDEATM